MKSILGETVSNSLALVALVVTSRVLLTITEMWRDLNFS